MLEIEDDLKRRAKIEGYIDRGFGSCELRDYRAAEAVENNWLHFDGKLWRRGL